MHCVSLEILIHLRNSLFKISLRARITYVQVVRIRKRTSKSLDAYQMPRRQDGDTNDHLFPVPGLDRWCDLSNGTSGCQFKKKGLYVAINYWVPFEIPQGPGNARKDFSSF